MKNNSSMFALNLTVCFIVLVIAFYFVFYLDWVPCPMCLIQQFCFVGVFVISLFAWLTRKSLPSAFSNLLKIITIVIIIVGVYVAANQVYLQYFEPSSVAKSCDAAGAFAINAAKLLTGTVHSCSDTSEKIYGFSLASYSLVIFVFLLVINALCFLQLIVKGKCQKC